MYGTESFVRHQYWLAEPYLHPEFADGAPASGAPAVLVIPGGYFRQLVKAEDEQQCCDRITIAQRFAMIGMHAFVLHYRTPAPMENGSPEDAKWTALIDAQRAMALISSHATEWGINPDKIGVVGMSAGGGLAAMLSNTWRKEHRRYAKVDRHDGADIKPAFAGLLFPGALNTTCCGATYNTRGKDAICGRFDEHDSCNAFSHVDDSLLMKVYPRPPPTFITHGLDDLLISYHSAEIFHKEISKQARASKTPLPKLVLYHGQGHGFVYDPACAAPTDDFGCRAGEGTTTSELAHCCWFPRFVDYITKEAGVKLPPPPPPPPLPSLPPADLAAWLGAHPHTNESTS
jgi:acetyl esterase/lipase